MATIGSSEFEANSADLLRLVESGEEVTVTRDGRAIARIIPVQPALLSEQRGELIQRWLERSSHPTLGGLSARDLINEGRA